MPEISLSEAELATAKTALMGNHERLSDFYIAGRSHWTPEQDRVLREEIERNLALFEKLRDSVDRGTHDA